MAFAAVGVAVVPVTRIGQLEVLAALKAHGRLALANKVPQQLVALIARTT